MATVNKDFKIKSGLVVEGTTATVNGQNILRETASDAYILGLTGGATLVKSVSSEFDVSGAGELSIDRATVDAYYDAAGDAAAAQAAAISAAAADATTKSNAAQAAAEATASADATAKVSAEAALRVSGDADSVSTASADATSKANAAQAAAEATASADATAKANAAQAAAEATASADATTKANAALASANTYTDGAVAGLVDSAPELLNTLNELAAALGDSPDTIANLTTLVGTKADTSYVNSEISDLNTAAQGYATAAQSAAEATASADATAKVAAEAALRVSGDATTLASAASDATTKANAAEAAAIAHADALDTDDVAEGTAQYFTDARAKTSAADLLTGATKTNITITGTGAGLTITAENGVADSTTSDLAEGTNLYFTDARAVTALETVVPNFTAVEVNSVAKQVASTLSAPTAGIQTAHAWAKADYRSAEFLVKVAYGDHTEISKVLLTLDVNDNIAITEYGVVGTNGSASTISAGISGANAQLLVTTVNNNSTVTVMGTLLA